MALLIFHLTLCPLPQLSVLRALLFDVGDSPCARRLCFQSVMTVLRKTKTGRLSTVTQQLHLLI